MKRERAGQATTKIFKLLQERNRPPEGQPWIWLTHEMLESPAWAAMPLTARKVVERIALEHMAHAGKHNGELTVTYDDFVRFGIRRSSAIEAIAIAAGLGWIDVTTRGSRAYGIRRVPSAYGLTWLPRHDGMAASNRWKTIDAITAEEIVAAAKNPGWRPKRKRKQDDTAYTIDIKSSHVSETGKSPQNFNGSSRENETGRVPKTRLANA